MRSGLTLSVTVFVLRPVKKIAVCRSCLCSSVVLTNPPLSLVLKALEGWRDHPISDYHFSRQPIKALVAKAKNVERPPGLNRRAIVYAN